MSSHAVAQQMPSEPNFGRLQEQKKFLQDGNEYKYNIYEADGPPSILLGTIGDICIHEGEIWYHGREKWELASTELDDLDRPRQCHPLLLSKRRLNGTEWKSQTTWNNKRRKLHNDSPNEIEPHVTEGVPIHNPNVIPSNSENQWILELYRMWCSLDSIKSITPIQPVGASILQELLSLPQALKKSPEDDSTLIFLQSSANPGGSPTLGHVIRDFMDPMADDHNIFDFVNRYGDPDVEYPEFLMNMLRASEGRAWDDSRRLYGALHIQSSEAGIGSCHLDAYPFSSEQHSLVDDSGWVSTWTPPAAISHTHMDYYGSMQYTIHFYGKKLWILWPSTPRNLAWFSLRHKKRADTNLTLDCIRNLEGLQLNFLDDTEARFAIKPNSLHACLSFGSSAHTGIQVWSYSHFDESHSIMEWGLQWLKGLYISRGQSRAEMIEEADIMNDEMEKWCSLVKRNINHPSTSRIQKEIKNLMDRLREIRNQLHITPPKPIQKRNKTVQGQEMKRRT